MSEKEGQKKGPEPSEVLGGTLNLFGIKLDLGDLLGAPEELQTRLGELRERLKKAGGKEVLSDQEWKQGAVVTGYVRTRGILGEREFHIGTMGEHASEKRGKAPARPVPAEAVEPPVDVFDEGSQVNVVADVPGVNLDDLELKAEANAFSLATKPTAHRNYRKSLTLDSEIDPASLQATCRNGVLEVRLRKIQK